MKRIGIGVVGCGTIGTGVVKVLREKGKELAQKTGVMPELVSVCDTDPKRTRGLTLPAKRCTSDYREVLANPRVDLVVELVGGVTFPETLIREAFRAGKSVVTANKALLAEKGDRLFALAAKEERHLGFEASVAGAIPIIKTIRESFAANRINSLYGILNGTTNFILTRIAEDRVEPAAALKTAQREGYAERDPSLDLNGTDSAHKLSVLATLLTGKFFPASNLLTEGIANLAREDIENAAELGYTIKLLSILRVIPAGDAPRLMLATYPALIPARHLLSSVRNVYNAVYLTGDLTGEMLLVGKGAGRYPTASSVVSDIISIGEKLAFGVSPSPVLRETGRDNSLLHPDEFENRYYFRFTPVDRPGVFARIAEVLGRFQISIASCIQKEENPREAVPVVVTTHRAREADVRSAIKEIDRLPVIRAKTVFLRLALEAGRG